MSAESILRDAEFAAQDPPLGAAVLDDVVRLERRFVFQTTHQADATALFVGHTYAIDAADTTPYLHVSSPSKRAGKTRKLEVMELLVRCPLPTVNISDAALFRTIAELNPTILQDEVDAIFGNKARDREDLRGMYCAGYRRGAVARRMGGTRMTTLEAFPVFCAKVFAGIGDLPDTIADRTIRIRLERRTRDEHVERFRRREVEPEAAELRDRLALFFEPQVDALRGMRPALPDELDDRAQDCWEPLLAIAELAGGDWPERAWAAALALSGPEARQDEDDSLSTRLLADIQRVFLENAPTRYRTADLIERLSQIEESPWGDWYGKQITPQALSKLLVPHGIKTMAVKIQGETVRGYKAEQFNNAFRRMLSVTGVTSVTSAEQSQKAVTESNAVTPSQKEAVTADPASEARGNAGNRSNAPHAREPTGNGHAPDDELSEEVERLATVVREGLTADQREYLRAERDRLSRERIAGKAEVSDHDRELFAAEEEIERLAEAAREAQRT